MNIKNLNVSNSFLKYGDFQRKGHNEKELDKRQIKRIETEKKEIFLTFDICPSDSLDMEIFDWLIDNHIQASLFITVESMNTHKYLNNIIENSNFTIGGHGYKHLDPLKQSIEEANRDIQAAYDWWLNEKSIKLKWYRVPYGHPTDSSINKMNSLGLKCASWTGPIFDRKAKGVKTNPNEEAKFYIDNNLHPGDIWVMHPNGTGINTFDILKESTKKIKDLGFVYKKL
jgi:peptidoglycan/xylan/chitin deacetylase (PgdA/CDA1 family)